MQQIYKTQYVNQQGFILVLNQLFCQNNSLRVFSRVSYSTYLSACQCCRSPPPPPYIYSTSYLFHVIIYQTIFHAWTLNTGDWWWRHFSTSFFIISSLSFIRQPFKAAVTDIKETPPSKAIHLLWPPPCTTQRAQSHSGSRTTLNSTRRPQTDCKVLRDGFPATISNVLP